MQYLPGQGIGHLAPLDYRHAVDQHMLHSLRQLIGAFKGSRVTDRCRIEDHDIGPHALLSTPRSVNRMRWAGNAVNFRMASCSVSFFSSLTYLRMIRGNVP